MKWSVLMLMFVTAFAAVGGCGGGDGGGGSPVDASGTWTGKLTASQGGSSITADAVAVVAQSGGAFTYTVAAAGETLSGGGTVAGNVLDFHTGSVKAVVSGNSMTISGTDGDGISWSGTLTRQ